VKVHHHTILACGDVPVELQDDRGYRYTARAWYGRFDCDPHFIHTKLQAELDYFNRSNDPQPDQDVWCSLVRWNGECGGTWCVICGFGKAPKVLN
jgi:hypothetical protein